MPSENITLVTGANGFIGRKLCMKLQKNGVFVRALLRKKINGPWDDVIVADLATDELLPSDFKNVSSIFHLAGKAHAIDELNCTPDEYFNINVGGTKKLLEIAVLAKTKKFIYCSSIKAMGEGGDIPLIESAPNLPITSYGKSKLAAEELVVNFDKIPHRSVFRPAMVYGPNNPGNLDKMINAISKGLFPPWPNIPNKRSMVHVDDVVNAALLIENHVKANKQIFIVTDGHYYSTSNIVNWIRKALKRKKQTIYIPFIALKWAAFLGDIISFIARRKMPLTSDNLAKLVNSSAYDSSKIQSMLGFRPEWDLESAIPVIIATKTGSK